jgi:hypothetical protein
MAIQLTLEQAHTVYTILVGFCGAPDTIMGRTLFVSSVTRPHDHNIEYRFQGLLGFGGKFYATRNRWYVSYYAEDETENRRILRDTANFVLNAVFVAYLAQPPAA